METKIVKGTCELMCSKNEEELRVRERLLNFYEFKDGRKNVPGILVSEFARSAAGMQRPKKFELRTEFALQKTVNYLLQTVITDKRRPFSHVYDFIFDRLRAVRQEMVIQCFEEDATVKILEPIIMFLSFSRYHLCEEAVDNFDPKICDQHLQECLKRVLCCYDALFLKDGEEMGFKEEKTRVFMECLYLSFNLGNPEALQRSLKVPEIIKRSPLFKQVRRVSLDFFLQNYLKTMMEIRELPHLLCAMCSLKMQSIRRNALQVFSYAYHNKTLGVPLDWLSKILFLSEDGLKIYLKYYEIEVNCDTNLVKFSKTQFSGNKALPKSIKEEFVEEKIKKIYLPELLLLKKF
ncbi:SAC3D1 family protein [Megaselia abdita]